MTPLREIFGTAGYMIEAAGVITIIVGFILSAIWFAGRLRRLDYCPGGVAGVLLDTRQCR